MCKRALREQRRRLLPETITKAAFSADTGNRHIFRVAALRGSLYSISKFAADIGEGHLRPLQYQANRPGSIRRSRSTSS